MQDTVRLAVSLLLFFFGGGEDQSFAQYAFLLFYLILTLKYFIEILFEKKNG